MPKRVSVHQLNNFTDCFSLFDVLEITKSFANLTIDLIVVINLGDISRINPDAEGLGSFLSHSYPFYKQGKIPIARQRGNMVYLWRSPERWDHLDARGMSSC